MDLSSSTAIRKQKHRPFNTAIQCNVPCDREISLHIPCLRERLKSLKMSTGELDKAEGCLESPEMRVPHHH